MKDLASLGHLFVCAFLYYFSASMVLPAITDVTMAALCPGRDQCSLAIYLSGFQQAVTGMGTLLVTPFVGNLSDRYGRKALLTLPMTVSIIPLDSKSGRRKSKKCLSRFLRGYGVSNLRLLSCGSTQADVVGEQRRAAAIGILSGFSMAGAVSGTLTSRFLSTALTFRVSATVAASATVYMRLFLVESSRTAADAFGSSQPILASTPSEAEAQGEPPLLSSSKGPSLWDMIGLLRSSLTLSRAAILAFLSCLGDGGLYGSLLYYLKARFHFNKDQFADLLLISGMAGAVSQVPYMAGMFVVVSIFSSPCIRSIVSKKVRSSEQGTAQGCISGIISFANIISPLVFAPLTALFLSESAPFHFPGFSIMCAGFVSMTAFIQSIIMTGP